MQTNINNKSFPFGFDMESDKNWERKKINTLKARRDNINTNSMHNHFPMILLKELLSEISSSLFIVFFFFLNLKNTCFE